jgi:Fur family ferric uptake transcriptional regulator
LGTQPGVLDETLRKLAQEWAECTAVEQGLPRGGLTEATAAALRSWGHRSGGARTAVIELLGRQHCCLTAQIFDQLCGKNRRVGIASVYRTLEQLTRDGFVHRIDIGGGTSRFEPIHTDGEHHHHLVCDDCGKVEALEDDELERALRKVEGQTGYSVAGYDVVLRGACLDCAPAESSPEPHNGESPAARQRSPRTRPRTPRPGRGGPIQD